MLCSLLALPFSIAGAATGEPADQGVTFDFDSVDIRSFIKIVSEITGENYVIDPSITGKITVTSPSPIARSAVPDVFQTVLEVYGFTSVYDGGIVKIVPFGRARQSGILGDSETEGIPGNAMETRILTVQTVDVNEIRSLLQPLLSPAGTVAGVPTAGTVIVTDLARNMARLTDLVRSLDQASPELTQDIRPLSYADASGIAESLNALFSSQSGRSGIHPVIVSEPRSNTLLIVASKRDLAAIHGLIGKLDQPLPETRHGVRVIRLKHADATAVAAILNAQLGQAVQAGETKEGRPNTFRSGLPVSITADPHTNSLVVSASPKEFQSIGDVVADLDIPRRQILVEALIVEISSDRTRDLGMEWRLTDPVADGEFRGVGGTNLSPDGSAGAMQQTALDPYHLPSGLVLGMVKGTVTFGGVEFANIGALARAMENASGVNILSTPHLLTLENEEAEIIVGEERPFLKSSQTTDNGAVVKSFELKDIGLTLRMTPRSTPDGQIVMKLFNEIKNFVAETDVGAVTSTKRQAKTAIRVNSGQMVAIGGLLKEDQIQRKAQVPCLGDIPGLGWLFRASRNSNTKTNLLIFISPYLIRDEKELDELTEKYKLRLSGNMSGLIGTETPSAESDSQKAE